MRITDVGGCLPKDAAGHHQAFFTFSNQQCSVASVGLEVEE